MSANSAREPFPTSECPTRPRIRLCAASRPWKPLTKAIESFIRGRSPNLRKRSSGRATHSNRKSGLYSACAALSQFYTQSFASLYAIDSLDSWPMCGRPARRQYKFPALDSYLIRLPLVCKRRQTKPPRSVAATRNFPSRETEEVAAVAQSYYSGESSARLFRTTRQTKFSVS